MKQPRKQHLIDTALTLFNQNGYHATGIDLILAEASVSKATLYKHFRSKEDLILVALKQRHEQLVRQLNTDIDGDDQRDTGLLSLFDRLHVWFNSKDFYGCNFINASAEYSQQQPIHRYAIEHKAQMMDIIRSKLATKDKHKAEQISLLIEGAIVMAHTSGVKDAALMAKEMAQLVIEQP